MGLTLAERRAVTETTAIRYSVADKRTKGLTQTFWQGPLVDNRGRAKVCRKSLS